MHLGIELFFGAIAMIYIAILYNLFRFIFFRPLCFLLFERSKHSRIAVSAFLTIV